MGYLDEYELTALEEIKKWRDRDEGVLEQALNTALAPFEYITEKIIPKTARQALEKAVLGALEGLKDLSYLTYSDETILKEARALGIWVRRCEELSNYDLRRLDILARQQFTSNRLMAALEGAGCGSGGLALILADVPIVFGLAFRAIQQIGTCYGFDMKDPEMWPILLEILSAAGANHSAAKSVILADLSIAAEALAKNWTYKKVAQQTTTGVIVQALKARTKTLPKEIAAWVTKRKLAQLIPLAGAAIGAGFNYWFMSKVCHTAYMAFRSIYLEKKRGPGRPSGNQAFALKTRSLKPGVAQVGC